MFLPSLDSRQQAGPRKLQFVRGSAIIAGLAFIVWSACGDWLSGQDLFRDQVVSILQKKCVTCHNDNDLDGDLSLQTAESFLKGGESGKIIDTNQPDESLLLEHITGEEPEMPQDADPLTAAEVESIRRWIEGGANWPKDFRIPFESGISRNWWSLKSVVRQGVPAATANPVDFFVAKKHRELGLSFSAAADKRTLIRRLYYDLTGLPPTPEEVTRFVDSRDPLAYQKLVDRLLDSPRYGERWARHWLDVVQYGETHGYDKDKPRMNAWPYRDYVIRAFNEDKLYSRFVKEQLAGDVLFPESSGGIVATGFIAAGPWDFIGHAEVPESKTDGQVARNLDRDNMVTSTMNSFCSLTIQCARCHNHKLDPVTMQEYYNLQSVFASMDRADREYDEDPEVARKRASLSTQVQEALVRLKQVNQKIDQKKSAELNSLDEQLAQLQKRITEKGMPRPTRPKARSMGYHSQVTNRQDDIKWVQLDFGKPTELDALVLCGAVEYGFDDFGFPHRFYIEASNTPDFSDAEILFDQRDRDYPRPGSLPVTVRFSSPVKARYIRLTATRLWSRRVNGQPKTGDWIFALGEMTGIHDGRELLVREVTAKDSIEAAPGWGKSNLVDHLYGGWDLETRLGKKESPSNGYHSQFSKEKDAVKWVQLKLNRKSAVDEIRIYPAFPTDFKDTPGFGFPIRFRIEGSSDVSFRDSKLLFSQTAQDFPNPLLKPLIVYPKSEQEFRFIRVKAERLWNRGDPGGGNHALALAEIEVLSANENVARNCEVTVSDSINSGRWHQKFLVDGFTSRLPIAKRWTYLMATGPSPGLKKRLVELKAARDQEFQRVVGNDLLAEKTRNESLLKELQNQVKSLPKPQKVYAGTVHQGSGAFRGRAGLGPREIFVLQRGDVTRKTDPAVPGTVAMIPNVSPVFQLPANHNEGERRVALAEWIVRKDNPLTWRSIVNRIWQHHFGKGLVDTPNDFGRGGNLPSHPQLLDWLAVEFRDGGKYLDRQSIKSLHRLICNSRTYKQESGSNRFSEVDGNNRFLWRMNRRRLSAEQIHDSVLQVTGLLNLEMGGPSYQDFVIERPEHSPHYEYHLYDPEDPATHRRAVYRFIVRSQPQPLMDTLNCADPSMSVPKRTETLTALQALGLLNNRFMVKMSEVFAERLKKESTDPTTQVKLGYELLTSRVPDADESRMLRAYAKKHGMENLCRVLFNLNEFIFVD